MQTKNNSKKQILVGGICLAALIIILAVLYTQFIPKAQDGSKSIKVEVIYNDKTSKTYDISTDAKYLRDALEQKKLVKGSESKYGLFISTVDGINADESKKEWWCITKNKGMVNTSVDQTPISDGDHFEITLTSGY